MVERKQVEKGFKVSKRPAVIKHATSEQGEAYFVAAKNPSELRRQFLESSKKAVLSLQNFHRLEVIRDRKLKELTLLRQSIKELVYLNRKFNDKLPRYDTSLLSDISKIKKESDDTIKAAKTALAQQKVPEKKPPMPVQREKTDMEKLEDSLQSIEKKLQLLQN